MTQKDKELLLKYLCMVLPYKVMIEYNNDGYLATRELGLGSLHDFMCDNAECKPYLRPMSSMTDKEKEEYHELCYNYYDVYFDTVMSIDWLNANHFDYRRDDEGKTMIKKGLALEAPKDMYNLKGK